MWSYFGGPVLPWWAILLAYLGTAMPAIVFGLPFLPGFWEDFVKGLDGFLEEVRSRVA